MVSRSFEPWLPQWMWNDGHKEGAAGVRGAGNPLVSEDDTMSPRLYHLDGAPSPWVKLQRGSMKCPILHLGCSVFPHEWRRARGTFPATLLKNLFQSFFDTVMQMLLKEVSTYYKIIQSFQVPEEGNKNTSYNLSEEQSNKTLITSSI